MAAASHPDPARLVGRVVFRILLRHGIALDSETAQQVNTAIRAVLQGETAPAGTDRSRSHPADGDPQL